MHKCCHLEEKKQINKIIIKALSVTIAIEMRQTDFKRELGITLGLVGTQIFIHKMGIIHNTEIISPIIGTNTTK